jgi:hypothetical protein
MEIKVSGMFVAELLQTGLITKPPEAMFKSTNVFVIIMLERDTELRT